MQALKKGWEREDARLSRTKKAAGGGPASKGPQDPPQTYEHQGHTESCPQTLYLLNDETRNKAQGLGFRVSGPRRNDLLATPGFDIEARSPAIGHVSPCGGADKFRV